MKKYIVLFLSVMLITGCGAKSESGDIADLKEEINNLKQQLDKQSTIDGVDIENAGLDEFKVIVEGNNQKIESLTKDKKDLEDKVKKLQDTNNSLTSKISELESSNKSLNSIVSSLNSGSSNKTTNQYTITKSQLIGSWKLINSNMGPIVFTDNCEVIGNWIIGDIQLGNSEARPMAYSYIYKDNKLYLSYGFIAEK